MMVSRVSLGFLPTSIGAVGVDLYRWLGAPIVDAVWDLRDVENDSDSRPGPLTIETRTVETTDEAGLLVTFGCVAP